MSGFSFASPWLLAAMAVLPLLWWLLRVVPPPSRRQIFPAIALLMGLEADSRAAERTPWWLVLLRLTLAACLIAAAAHPLLNAPAATSQGPLLLVLDDGWAAAKSWNRLHQHAVDLIQGSGRAEQPVLLLLTAPPPDGGKTVLQGPMPAAQALGLLEAAAPHPWPGDRAAAVAALKDAAPIGHAVWLSDGVEDGHARDLAAALSVLGPLEILKPQSLPLVLLPPRPDDADLSIRLLRGDGTASATVVAQDGGGRVLARQAIAFGRGDGQASAALSIPGELRNRVERLSIEEEASAAATVLLDPRWQRRPVGLARDGSPAASPLLDDLYYLDRALSPLAEVRQGPALDLLKRELSLLLLPDEGTPPPAEMSALKSWVESGGVLVRLAGPKLARSPDDLLPVTLRGGGRTLGGAMSWTRPMAVAPMPDSGPFAGLPVPADLRVKSQILADPAVDLNAKTWARLEDGTPLVTGNRLGKGWLVLIHTTVWPGWSNLGLSGLLPDMMQRLLDLSSGVAQATADHPLPPLSLLDGFGHSAAPSATVEPLPAKGDALPGPKHPPGLYGDEAGRRALNLSPSLSAVTAVPASLGAHDLEGQPGETDLQPPLLLLALALMLIDMAILLIMRKGGRRLFPLTPTLALALTVALSPSHGRAEQPSLQAALQPRLAYVVTGEAALDATSKAGLANLSQMLTRRTTASLGEPVGVSLDRDALAFYPLIYWPVPPHPKAPSPQARERINDYLRHGGMILFDSRDGGQGVSDALRLTTEGLDIPALAPVNEDHVLTHSFYILHDLPGRLAGAPVYVEDGADAGNDSVSPVVIGGNDWAAAWAVDADGQPLFAAVPGGETQREMANRFGINLVMYALTGNYKSDQVHLPALMERLRR
ncbi:MAG TPA: DUF4159 domain-containing protein [Candidatus Sulfotelmatobacter sp.]|jgi:hypothetical protein|nr:DUF4159 domain-containing protein [Candidatus Sulfotelmatobacter sp.]